MPLSAVAAPVIPGVGISDIGRRTGTAALDLTMQAVRRAIDDAGVAPADIDAVLTLGDVPAHQTAAALGIATAALPGAAPFAADLFAPIAQAYAAIIDGTARHVLIYRTVQMMGGSVGAEAGDGSSVEREIPVDMRYLIAGHAYSAANWIAMNCRRHMELYGTTKEQLGWVALSAREHASRNPLAVFRKPLTMDEYLAARVISTPFGLFDCDVPVDGSVALVVSSADHRRDCPNGAVAIEAIGGASGAGGWTNRHDYPKMAASDAAAQMWSRTDIGPGDVDIVELYDGFTFLTLAWLEALGFCGDGEGGSFVEGGQRISAGGELPTNTYGGQLSAGRLHGYWLIYEACQQLRGRAVAPLPARPEVAVASAGGGPIAGCMLLTC
jgi:acetyl-CoA acetyltransferase